MISQINTDSDTGLVSSGNEPLLHVDPDPFHHMASLDPSELNNYHVVRPSCSNVLLFAIAKIYCNLKISCLETFS